LQDRLEQGVSEKTALVVIDGEKPNGGNKPDCPIYTDYLALKH
jgi:hypothetical protein